MSLLRLFSPLTMLTLALGASACSSDDASNQEDPRNQQEDGGSADDDSDDVNDAGADDDDSSDDDSDDDDIADDDSSDDDSDDDDTSDDDSSDDDSDDDDTSDDDSSDDDTSDDDVPDTTSALIEASEGGTLVSSDGLFRLEIPPGALNDDTEIEITAVAEFDGELAEEGVSAGYRLLPDGLTFNEPATAIFLLDEDEMFPSEGTIALPAVFTLDETHGVEVPATGLATLSSEDELELRAPLFHFTDVGVGRALTVTLETSCDVCETFAEHQATVTITSDSIRPISIYELRVETEGAASIVLGTGVPSDPISEPGGAVQRTADFRCDEAGPATLSTHLVGVFTPGVDSTLFGNFLEDLLTMQEMLPAVTRQIECEAVVQGPEEYISMFDGIEKVEALPPGFAGLQGEILSISGAAGVVFVDVTAGVAVNAELLGATSGIGTVGVNQLVDGEPESRIFQYGFDIFTENPAYPTDPPGGFTLGITGITPNPGNLTDMVSVPSFDDPSLTAGLLITNNSGNRVSFHVPATGGAALSLPGTELDDAFVSSAIVFDSASTGRITAVGDGGSVCIADIFEMPPTSPLSMGCEPSVGSGFRDVSCATNQSDAMCVMGDFDGDRVQFLDPMTSEIPIVDWQAPTEVAVNAPLGTAIRAEGNGFQACAVSFTDNTLWCFLLDGDGEPEPTTIELPGCLGAAWLEFVSGNRVLVSCNESGNAYLVPLD